MDQINEFADSRLLNGCFYCGGVADTRDHVPSKCLLESPYPSNLTVVGCCSACNEGFSKDEEYLICLLESVLCGSTDPEKINRPSVAKTMRHSPALRNRIQDSRTIIDGQVAFLPEMERVKNVMLKLARGHAGYELSQTCRSEPDHYWCGPLYSLSQETRENFDSVHFQQSFGEVGSRNMQRLIFLQISFQNKVDEQGNEGFLINDWIDVQEGLYRFIAIDDMGTVVIRIVIGEYFACEVAWEL